MSNNLFRKPHLMRRVWNSAYPYTFGVMGAFISLAYTGSERAYLSPITDDHLIWIWGVSTLAFILFTQQMRAQVTHVLLVHHGFLHTVRGTSYFQRLVALHVRAATWCRITYLVSFVLGGFYYMFPNTYAVPAWLGLVITSKLLMNRAVAAWELALEMYNEIAEPHETLSFRTRPSATGSSASTA